MRSAGRGEARSSEDSIPPGGLWLLQRALLRSRSVSPVFGTN
jgi:hypothetical protein